jgi:adenylate cyclase
VTDTEVERIANWVIACGLDGASEPDLLRGFCHECRGAGVDLSRAMAIVDTLHPVYEGRAFRWRNDGADEATVIEYGSSSSGQMADTWQQSAFHHLLVTGADQVRRRLGHADPTDFNNLETLKAEGETDFLAFSQQFAAEGRVGELDAVYSSWTTRRPSGFTDDEVRFLARLMPVLALGLKCASLARIAGTLVEVYLGRDAGRRVLAGRIARGVAERISAVLWFSDLRGFTTITDSAEPDEIIPLLNDYADVVISAIHQHGGEVLKLIGDGTLAIFRADDPADACTRALAAEATMRDAVRVLNARRAEAGHPTTVPYLGLHVGEVFYGNIGSDDRLDFTVVGPAVNEVSRVASMCRSVDRLLLVSEDFVTATPADARARLVSVGRFALRGVGRAQELFTLDPSLLRSDPTPLRGDPTPLRSDPTPLRGEPTPHRETDS